MPPWPSVCVYCDRCMRVSVVSADKTRRPITPFQSTHRRPSTPCRTSIHSPHATRLPVFFGRHTRKTRVLYRSRAPGFRRDAARTVSGAMVPVRAAIGAYKIVFVQAKPEARRALTLATRLTFCPPACPCHPPPCRPPSRSPCRRPSPWPSPCRPRRPSPA